MYPSGLRAGDSRKISGNGLPSGAGDDGFICVPTKVGGENGILYTGDFVSMETAMVGPGFS